MSGELDYKPVDCPEAVNLSQNFYAGRFALTINQNQGQPEHRLHIYLLQPILSQGHMYVSL